VSFSFSQVIQFFLRHKLHRYSFFLGKLHDFAKNGAFPFLTRSNSFNFYRLLMLPLQGARHIFCFLPILFLLIYRSMFRAEPVPSYRMLFMCFFSLS
jgi:hypothetical protein